MNYRHAFHAGNFADVVKHVALVSVLLHLRKKRTPFAVIDSHAGRGLYDLSSPEARRTGESANGIGKLHGLEGPAALNRYLALATDGGAGAYPGSPLISAKLLRPQDRLAAIEKHPEEATFLKRTLLPFRNARVQEGDGYDRLIALLPPRERRGLVLIDPPFETPDEFILAAAALRGALRRFANGIYLVWYPVKSNSAANAFVGEVLAAGAARALSVEIAIAPPPSPEKSRLARAALLVVNPPYGFDTDMNAILALIAPRIGGTARICQLAGTDPV